MVTMVKPTKGMKTTLSGFQLADLLINTVEAGDPHTSICPRCLTFNPIFKLTLNDAGDFVCVVGCEEYQPLDKSAAL